MINQMREEITLGGLSGVCYFTNHETLALNEVKVQYKRPASN